MDTPNYYAIIPANVRYCDDICANAKLLYGEITALCNAKGYCYATNKYFAELYKLKRPQTISDWVKQLEKNGFVSVELVYQGKEIAQRLIRIAPAETLEVQRKNVIPNNEKTLQGTTKKRCDNNTRKNNKIEYIQPVPQQVEGIYIFFNEFDSICQTYYTEGCAVRNTKKSDSLEQCYLNLVNNALAGAGLPKLAANSEKRHNPTQSDLDAVKSEIKKFADGLEFYRLEKARFEQGKSGFYAAKLIKSILIKNEYSNTVKGNAAKVNHEDAVLDWRVAFLPKLQKINSGLTAKNLDYLLSASRVNLGMIIHRENTALIRSSIGEFVKNNVDKNLPALSQKETKQAFKAWISESETGRAFVVYAKEKQPIFLQEMAVSAS